MVVEEEEDSIDNIQQSGGCVLTGVSCMFVKVRHLPKYFCAASHLV